MRRSVFLSYSDKDRELAQELLAALERRGLNCWIAPRDIPPGGSYAESIMNAIEQCESLVLLFTRNSNASPHVLREVEQALRLRRNIMPVRCDDSPVSKALDYLLATVHWLNALPQGAALDGAAAQIASALPPQADAPLTIDDAATQIGSQRAAASEGGRSDQKPLASSQPRVSAMPIVVALVVAIAAGAAFLFWRARPHEISKSPDTSGPPPAASLSPTTVSPAPSQPDLAESGENVLAAENGGQVVIAPNAAFVGVIDGKEDQVFWFSPRDEGVFGFKDGAEATLSGFASFAGAGDSHNLKEFELLASEAEPESAGAGVEKISPERRQFRSLGRFTTQANASGYQTFHFAPRKMRYLKIKLLSAHDSNDPRIELYEFRAFGQFHSTGAAKRAENPPPAPPENLLSRDNGASVALAPAEHWAETIDGREDQVYWFEPHEEAVFQFKNSEAATFNSFGLFLPDNDEHNLKEFELLSGNDSPTGDFHLLGRFTTYNARVGGQGYQDFHFAEVHARYLKVRLLAPHSTTDPRIYLYEFRVTHERE